MNFNRRDLNRALALGLAMGSGLARAAAPYPTRPITLIVPFAPGGGNDTVARVLGQSISGPLGQPVVIDNRPGAGGSLGAQVASHAPADGYTLFLGGVGSHALNPAINPRLGYDPIKDFTPIAELATAPMVLAVHPSVPVRDVKELIAYAKKHPRELNFASNGNGSSSQLAAVIFNSMAGTQMTHVPYKGLSPALVDLLSGTVQLMFSSTVAIMPNVQSGKLKVLGVTSPHRLPAYPDIPTIAEQGLPAYQSGSWYGILAPRGIPAEAVARLNAELNTALRNPAVREKLDGEGAVAVGGTPQEFAAHIRAELQRVSRFAKEIKAD